MNIMPRHLVMKCLDSFKLALSFKDEEKSKLTLYGYQHLTGLHPKGRLIIPLPSNIRLGWK